MQKLTANFSHLVSTLGVDQSEPLAGQVANLLDLTVGHSRLTGELHNGKPIADDTPDYPWVGVVFYPSEQGWPEGQWRPIVISAYRPTTEYNEAAVVVLPNPQDREPLPTLEQLVAHGWWQEQ